MDFGRCVRNICFAHRFVPGLIHPSASFCFLAPRWVGTEGRTVPSCWSHATDAGYSAIARGRILMDLDLIGFTWLRCFYIGDHKNYPDSHGGFFISHDKGGFGFVSRWRLGGRFFQRFFLMLTLLGVSITRCEILSCQLDDLVDLQGVGFFGGPKNLTDFPEKGFLVGIQKASNGVFAIFGPTVTWDNQATLKIDR